VKSFPLGYVTASVRVYLSTLASLFPFLEVTCPSLVRCLGLARAFLAWPFVRPGRRASRNTGSLPVRGGKMFISNKLGRSLILFDLKVLLRGKRVYSSVNSRDGTLIIGIHSVIIPNSLFCA
jgi:hypothetical protein